MIVSLASADNLVLDRPSPTEGLSFLSDDEGPQTFPESRSMRYSTDNESFFEDFNQQSHGTWTSEVARDRPNEPSGAAYGELFNADKFRLMRRLRMLKRLPDNHDGEGASAAIATSVDSALAFLGDVCTVLRYGATLDDEGRAVFEFEDRATGVFADVTFLGDTGSVECYRRKVGEPSNFVSGKLTSQEVRSFLQEAGITA